MIRFRFHARRNRRILRAAALLLSLVAMVFVACVARPAAGQSAGTTNLLSSPATWPTTGAISGTTALGLDPSAIYLNPAGLAMQDERSLLVQHGLLQFDTDWDFAAVGYPIPGLGAVGLGLARIGTSGVEGYDEQNRPLGDFGYSETALAASVARRAIGPLYAGVTFKVLSQSLGDVAAAAPAVDLGLVYRPARFRGAQAGLSAQNVMAGSLDLGGAVPAVDRSFRLGVAGPEWRVGGLTAIRAAADVARHGSEGMKPRVAVEFTRRGLGAVRAGLNNGKPVFGVGVQYRRYGVDVAIAQGEVEMTQQFAVRVAWGEPVSQYESKRRAEYSRAAEDSLRARRAQGVAQDRARAEAAETARDWETALVLWEVLLRERPDEPLYAGRAERARKEITARARAEVSEESARRLSATLADLSWAALRRGDVEEAAGLARALLPGGVRPGGAAGESLKALEAEIAAARNRAATRAAARADSLRAGGRLLAAAGEAALALRLRPGDPRATALWSTLEGTIGKSAAETFDLSRRLEALTAVHQASQAFNDGRYADAEAAVKRALAADPTSEEARAWRERIERRLSTPKPELTARIKQLYIKGMEAFTSGDYKEALRNWEQILVLDPLNESARRNVLEARERMKSEARR
jgi:tetratricopeptide (TPR) repeat protein